MSRSGYVDDLDQWELIRYRGAVASAIRGRRGQQFLRDMLEALDAMPEKRLITGELVTESGEYCALGVVGAARGLPLDAFDPYDHPRVALKLDIAEALSREITFENDEGGFRESPEARWRRMRRWVVAGLVA